VSRPAKILIVEDEAAIGLWFRDLLHQSGYEVAGPAFSEEQAFLLIDEVQVDAALLDIKLNGGDSFCLARELAEHGVPVIFVSGRCNSLSLPNEFQGCGFVSKPANEPHLLKLVAMAIQAKAG